MLTNLYSALLTGTTDPRVISIARLLTQLSDETLSVFDTVTGDMPSQLRAAVRSARMSAGRGPVISRLIEVDHSQFSDREYRTFCFSRYVAAAVMLSQPELLLHLQYYMNDDATKTVVTEPVAKAAFDAVKTFETTSQLMTTTVPDLAKIRADAAASSQATPQVNFGRIFIRGIAMACGLTTTAASVAVAKALSKIGDSVSFDAWLFKSMPSHAAVMSKFFYMLAGELQSGVPFQQSDALLDTLKDEGSRNWLAKAFESGGPTFEDFVVADMLAEPTYYPLVTIDDGNPNESQRRGKFAGVRGRAAKAAKKIRGRGLERGGPKYKSSTDRTREDFLKLQFQVRDLKRMLRQLTDSQANDAANITGRFDDVLAQAGFMGQDQPVFAQSQYDFNAFDGDED